MFPSAPDPSPTPSLGWRDALRHAAELTVAFTTLESYTVDDVWPPRRAGTSSRTGQALPLPAQRQQLLAARRDLPGSPLAATAATEAAHDDRARTGRSAAAGRNNRRAGAERRPGTGRTAPQPCTTPLAAARPSAFAPATAAAARTAAARTTAARTVAPRTAAARTAAAHVATVARPDTAARVPGDRTRAIGSPLSTASD